MRMPVIVLALASANLACARARDAGGSGSPPGEVRAPMVGRDSAFGPTAEVDSTGRVTPIAGAQGLGAKAWRDCAPHDGPAIRLAIDLSKRDQLVVSLWGIGYDRLTGGRASIVLDGEASSRGSGHASICPPTGGNAANPCRAVTARLELEASGRRDGDSIRGRVFFREAGGPERVQPFTARIESPAGGGPICG